MSAFTRVTIEPTVRHATRNNSHHRGLRGAHREPRREVIEVASVARTVTGPRHRRDRHTMITAPHSRRVRFEEHLRRAQIQRSPPTPTFTEVITR